MVDPVRTILLDIEAEIARLPAAALCKPRAGRRADERMQAALGREPPPGYRAFYARYDGGALGPGVQLLSIEESRKRIEQAERSGPLRGLWPCLERDGRLYALDAEGAVDREWPVVEVVDRSIDRAGSSFLRFLHAVLAQIAPPRRAGADDGFALARELCRRDPGLAAHWVALAEALARAGRQAEADEALAAGLRHAQPLGSALLFAVGLRACEADDPARALVAFEDAAEIEALDGRDDDARLDAAAALLVLSTESGQQALARRARELLGQAAASTGSYWRGEALRAHAEGRPKLAAFAARIVKALVPEDMDIARLDPPDARLQGAVRAFAEAREALDRGDAEGGLRHARAAVAERPNLGVFQATLAEALNLRRDRAALDAAARAVELNPGLIEAWRELGDAYLEARQAVKAEAAYRKAIARDATYGLGYAKLAQALLEQGRNLEALDAVNAAAERGGDAFFQAAVRGDVLAEMSRHGEAAEAYDQAAQIEPEDHWVLHQAAIEHSLAGNHERATEMYERALRCDREGCHQTLVDYADLLRRVGRIGDAVRLYRKAVAANPNEPEWRHTLREAERELMQAPN